MLHQRLVAQPLGLESDSRYATATVRSVSDDARCYTRQSAQESGQAVHETVPMLDGRAGFELLEYFAGADPLRASPDVCQDRSRPVVAKAVATAPLAERLADLLQCLAGGIGRVSRLHLSFDPAEAQLRPQVFEKPLAASEKQALELAASAGARAPEAGERRFDILRDRFFAHRPPAGSDCRSKFRHQLLGEAGQIDALRCSTAGEVAEAVYVRKLQRMCLGIPESRPFGAGMSVTCSCSLCGEYRVQGREGSSSIAA